MKTGIIVYSKTGHTKQAAQKLLDALRSKGEDAELLEVKVSNPAPEKEVNRLQFVNSPKVDVYDKLVFAAPVWAFSLSGVMKAYLAGLSSLKGKAIRLFVTHQFPLPWMGGNAAIRQMQKLCEEKGGKITSHAIISWGEKRREHDLSEMVNKLA